MENTYRAVDTETYLGKAFILSTADAVFPIDSPADIFRAFDATGFRRFVFYNIDYDATALLKHFPRSISEALYLDRPADWEGKALRYIPGKYLKLGGFECFDLYSFFQTSLDHCARRFLNRRKRELPSGMVENLSPSVYRANRFLIDEYAREDSAILQELVDRVLGALVEIGLPETVPLYSPGYIAKRVLKSRGVTVARLPFELLELADDVYFGGRIEVIQRGSFDNAYCYDIKSAYPHALTVLPDISRAKLYRSEHPETDFYLARVLFTEKPGLRAYPIAHKNAVGVVTYPRHVNGDKWVTSFEHAALLDSGAAVRVVEAINIVAPAEQSPLSRFVEETFPLRAGGGFVSLVYKLILNSLYGILAEKRKRFRSISIERAHRKLDDIGARLSRELLVEELAERCPEARYYFMKRCSCEYCRAARKFSRGFRAETVPLLEHEDQFYERVERRGYYSNRLYAAFVTAFVRVRLWRELSRPGSIAGFTDSVFTTEPSADFVPGASGLGEWGFEREGPLTMVGSGIYEHADKTKWRGFRTRTKLRELLATMNGPVSLMSGIDRVSIARAVQRGFRDYSDVNILRASSKVFDVNFDRKRSWPRPFASGRAILEDSPMYGEPLLYDCSKMFERRHGGKKR